MVLAIVIAVCVALALVYVLLGRRRTNSDVNLQAVDDLRRDARANDAYHRFGAPGGPMPSDFGDKPLD